jgi:PAS domain S-box-containing protein
MSHDLSPVANPRQDTSVSDDSISTATLVLDRSGIVLFADQIATRNLDVGPKTLVGSCFGWPVVTGKPTTIEIARAGGGFRSATLRLRPTTWEGHDAWLAILDLAPVESPADGSVANQPQQTTNGESLLAENGRLDSLPIEPELQRELERSIGRLSKSTAPVGLAIVELRHVTEPSQRPEGPAHHLVAINKLRAAVRKGDFVTTLGGDYLAVICEGVTGEGGHSITERLQHSARASLVDQPWVNTYRSTIVFTDDARTEPAVLVSSVLGAIRSMGTADPGRSRRAGARDRVAAPGTWISPVRTMGQACDQPPPEPLAWPAATRDEEHPTSPHGESEPNHSHLSSIIDRATDGILVIDSRGAIRFANPAAAAMFGRTVTEMSGMIIGLPITNGQTTEAELVRPGEPESVIFVEFRVTESEWGGEPALLALLRDMTERHLTELGLIRINAQLVSFIADLEAAATFIAHDLEQPVASVQQCLHALRAPAGEVDPQTLLMLAGQSMDAMRQLIRTLLEYGSSGYADFVPVEVDCERLVDECRATMLDLSGTVKVGPLPKLVTDERLLRQVLQNLIVNGLKHRRPDTEPIVEVSAHLVDHGWRFTVTDNGPGVPASIRERIFEAFWRPGDDQPGKGLGLAACRWAVARLGGSIWVEDAPVWGSRFCFILPQLHAVRPTETHA